MDFDISAVADNQPTVYLRWTMGATDSGWQYCGWNIDDIAVTSLECVPQILLGDMNCDGAVNGQDIDGFVYVLFGAPPYTQYYTWTGGRCNHLHADMNGDGLVNGQDIDAFTATLFGK